MQAVKSGSDLKAAFKAFGDTKTDQGCKAQAVDPVRDIFRISMRNSFRVAPSETASQQLHKTQGRWIVTRGGHLKMVHDSSERTQDWVHKESCVVSDAVPVPLTLQVVEQEAKGDFHLSVHVSAGVVGFSVDQETLRIYGLAESAKQQTALEEGDLIVAVSGTPVKSYDEFLKLTVGRPKYELTVRPSNGVRDNDLPPLVAQQYCCIEFEVAEILCKEGAGTLKVPLRRVGDVSKNVAWPWGLANCNVADSAFKSVSVSGEAVFAAGEEKTCIVIDVPLDPTWNVEGLMIVYLDLSKVAENREQDGTIVFIGDNIQVSVYTLNNVTFPAGAFGTFDKLQTTVSEWTLALKFVKHNFTEIPWETKVAVVLCCIPPLVFYFQQLVLEMLLNCVLVQEGAPKRCKAYLIDLSVLGDRGHLGLFIFAILFLVLAMVQHFTEVRFRRLKLGGKATMMLRANIFATMLQLSDKAKRTFGEGEVEKVLGIEVESAVNMVWLNAFVMLRKVLQLAAKVSLTVRIVSSLDTVRAILLSGLLPLITVCVRSVFRIRARRQAELCRRHVSADQDWFAFATMCSSASPLILAYRRGWHFTKSFAACHSTSNKAGFASAVHAHRTEWMLRYFLLGVNAAVLLYAGREVQRGLLALGSYLVLFRSISGFGKEAVEVTTIATVIVGGVAAVSNIAKVLNSCTRRMERLNHDGPYMSSDEMCIQLDSVHFMHPGAQAGQSYALAPTNLKVPAGQLVCMPKDSMSTLGMSEQMPGVNTFFNVISGALLPDGGTVRLPSCWRVIFVPVTPMLFDGTLMYNLFFSDRAENEQAVWDACRSLGMSSGLIGKADFDVGPAGAHLRFSDRVVVSIVRALMHDVDLLLLSSCLDVLGEGHAVKVLRFLRKFCRWRGLPHEELPLEIRHCKTVLYTSKYKALQDLAAYTIEAEAGLW